MSPRLAVPATNSQPADLGFLARYRRARAAATDALRDVAGTLGIRVQPRWLWDDLARPEHERRVVHDRDARMCRLALIEAQRRGPEMLARVAASVDCYLLAKRAEIFCGFEHGATVSLAAMAAVSVRELAEAAAAQAECVAEPRPSNLYRALRETAEARAACERSEARLAAEIAQ